MSSAAAYKKSAANAMARLSTLSQKALKTSASRSSEGDTLLLSNTPESMPVDNSEGKGFDITSASKVPLPWRCWGPHDHICRIATAVVECAGTFDEAFRRRKQADLARAELNKKIEASRRRREVGTE